MKNKAFVIIALSLVFSCSPDKSDRTPAPPPLVPVDSLNGWQKIVAPGNVLDIVFTDPARGVIATEAGLFRSADSGKTWIQASPSSTHTVHFADAQYGYALGNNILRTRDSGKSWTQASTNGMGLDITFTSPAVGYLAANHGLFKTTDSASTWQLMQAGSWQSVFFLDRQNGWACKGNMVYRTFNGGASWSDINTVPGFGLFSIFFIDPSRGWVASSSEAVFRTQNGGASFEPYQLSDQPFDIQFLDANLGYLTAGRRIYKSVNGGQTWNPDATMASGEFIELFFLDANTGWAAGRNSVVLRWKR